MDRGLRTTGLTALLLLSGGAAAQGAVGGGGADWRRQATAADRVRLHDWRSAWRAALAEARGAQDGAAAVAADAALFDPDRALADPMPPPGPYRCRTVKLGRRGTVGPVYVAYDWYRCRVDGAGLTKLDGSQRPVGGFLPDTAMRGVFLGTLVLGDESRAMRYGRDRGRDLAGIVERIAPARWRIAFPYPAFESKLDVIELVPAR